MIKQLISAALVGAIAFALPASATPGGVDRGAAERRIQETAGRLNVNSAQRPAVEAILRESAGKRQAVFEKFGFKGGARPKLKPLQMRDLRDQMNAISEETTRKLAAVLTPAQMAEYEKIKEEQREAMREQIQGR